jgi:hypothetical protein
MKSQNLLPTAFFAISLFLAISVHAGKTRALHGHVPEAAALSQPLGRLPETNVLRLAISLPLHNSEALTNLLQRLYDSASPDYHHYLTPAQFNENFGPTEQDYQAVIHFAQSNGMAITARDSRMLLDVQGKVSDIEKAFHVTLRTYQHPTEARQFFAPDVEPSVDADLPILNIYGLGDYAVPRPMVHLKAKRTNSVPAAGSQANGYYLGSDFRHAYAPSVTLNGAGQMVGLLELDGYYPTDITDYESLAGLTNVPVQPIPLDGYNGSVSANNIEVALDIEMAIAMAPGLTTVYVFEAPSTSGTTGWIDILDSMAASNQIKQFSSSWGYTGSPDPDTSFDTEFQKMATQGQSFYQASGDGDAWINPIWVPGDSPYLTSVGGTLLTMNGSGASYSSEAVWNEGNLGSGNGWSANENTGKRNTQNDYIGSGGGVSGVYTIPSWQASAINTTNQGSSTKRNIPDVALTGDDIWIYYDDGSSGAVAGTSCAAPLWAGFTALINQQAAAGGSPMAGFINPAIYTLGKGTAYASVFHDITVGNDTNTYSTNRYVAVTGYDLCTGWGTPNGAAMINALSIELKITPSAVVAASGPYDGPFTPTNFILTNIGTASFNWSVANTSTWMTVSISNGTLAPAGSPGASASVGIGFNAATSNLNVGNYTNTLSVTDLFDSMAQSRQFILTISKATPALTWPNPAAITYGAPLTSSQLDATANTTGNFAYTPAAGTVFNSGTRTLSVVFTPGNTTDYNSTTDSLSLVVSPAPLTVTASNATRTYGQPNPVFTGTLNGVTNGDNITATYACGATTNSPAGTYPMVPSLVDPNNRRTNYNVTTNNGTLTITKATPLLNWPTPSSINYPAALSSDQLDATASVPGGFAYNPSAGTVPAPGVDTLSVLFTPADTVDYCTAAGSVSLSVSLVPIALDIQLVNNNVILTWCDPDSVFALQAAPDVTSVFTNVPGAASPCTNAITGAQQFFRLMSN